MSKPPNQEGSTAFRGDPGGAGVHGGMVVLVEVYAAIWLLVFAFILWTLQRQRRMNARIDELERQLERAGTRQGQSSADAAPDG